MTYICYPTTYTPDPEVAPVSNGGTFISQVPAGKTAAEYAAEAGLDMSEIGVFDENDYTPSHLHFVECFNIESDNTVTFDLEKAKSQTLKQVRASLQFNVPAYGFKKDFLIAQSTLPEADRLPDVQAYFDALNAKAAEIATAVSNIQNAADPSALTTELGLYL